MDGLEQGSSRGEGWQGLGGDAAPLVSKPQWGEGRRKGLMCPGI